MNDALIRQATCRVSCASESGTGWLVTPSHVVTARHCVADAIEGNAEVTLQFGTGESAQQVRVSVVAHDTDLDVCLLLLPTESSFTPIVASAALPREGVAWSAFGYPVVKLDIGHRAEGTISQVLDSPEMSIDLDLHVTGGSDLSDYRGLSGSALICNGQCHGIVRLAVDRPICAISIAQAAGFLAANGIPMTAPAASDEEQRTYAERSGFQEQFEQLVTARGGGYFFLEGAHGIGKSTFCETFQPQSAPLEAFGTYSFTAPARGINAMHRVQPEMFHDWLNTLVSRRSSGKPARVSDRPYRQLIDETGALMNGLAQEYAKRGKVGILFVDGLDEAARLGGTELTRFLGLLPVALPPGLVVVFTAPNYANLAAVVGARVESRFVLALPSLTREAVRDYCISELGPKNASPTTVAVICDRTEGNPLYLRYLIDYVNIGATEEQVADVPGFGGSIRNYYDSLWGHLVADPDAANLLGILARLRWGISVEQLSDLLTENERAAYVPTLNRIRHLLRDPQGTSIYHASFADYLAEKTNVRELDIQRRLADYCRLQPGTDYGTLNVVYHALRAGTEEAVRGVAACQQDWVDRCVTLGADPDLLLGDIDEALEAATRWGDPVQVIRVLLLSHRLDFRYDTLFAQSASFIAEALIAVGRGPEALQHAIRYGRLIVPPAEAFRIALKLIEAQQIDAARDLLEKADLLLMERFNATDLSIGEFLQLTAMRAQLLLLLDRTGAESASDQFLAFNLYVRRMIQRGVTDEGRRQMVVQDMSSALGASLLAVSGRYISLAMLERISSRRPDGVLEANLRMMVQYQSFRQFFSQGVNSELMQQVFADLQTLVRDAEGVPPVDVDVLDVLILFGAPAGLIEGLASTGVGSDQELRILKEDNVSVDLESLSQGIAHRRVESYLQPVLTCPPECDWHSGEWLNDVRQVFSALAWCDGAARRAKVQQDAARLQEVWTLLAERVMDPLRLTLQQRASWKDSYAIPESAFPEIYKLLTGLCLDVYPEHLGVLLSLIEERFSDQCGLYSEGFRRVLSGVFERLATEALEPAIGNRSFPLLQRWSGYVQRNVKNRHELVPELLRLVPLFAKWGADEEARRIHRLVLSVSMGPTWYKEDQLTLMVGTLEHFPSAEALEADILSRIAGSLERASGEMTFQRYVRYDKAALLGELCRRGHYADAVRYFLRQTCGTSEELLAEATQGEMDRPSPLRGLRFPGGALDEQDAILRMARSIGASGDWPVCWALLEAYQHGDDRHIGSAAAAYARLAGTTGVAAERAWMKERLLLLVKTELSQEDAEKFLREFQEVLAEPLRAEFEELLRLLPKAPASEQATPPAPKVETGPATTTEGSGSFERDDLFLPGTFGTSRSTRESGEALARAEAKVARLNIEAARSEALSALQLLQGGGWSIWGNLSPEAFRAEELLRNGIDDPNALVKWYGPLILAERHVEKWRRADHLIGRVAGLLNAQQRAAMIQVVLEHVQHLVGDASLEAKEYEFLGTQTEGCASDALLRLLLTLVDHPRWIRQAKAADMILWLLEKRRTYMANLAPLAFTAASGFQADVICGVLDSLSTSRPLEFWTELEAVIDLDRIQSECKHAGRLGVLLRIATRGAQKGAQSAAAAVARLRQLLNAPAVSDKAVGSPLFLPPWADSIASEWRELAARGLVNAELVRRIEGNMAASCAPLSLETSFELEGLLSQNFRESVERPLARWEAKVRHAVLVALSPTLSEADLLFVEQLFRVYNPSPLHRLRMADFVSPAERWVQALSQGRIASVVPARDSEVYLDFQVRLQQEQRFRYLRLTAFFYQERTRAMPPDSPATFESTETPRSGHATALELCARVEPRPALFGALTPAIPSPALMQIIGSTAPLRRGYWRETRIRSIRDPWPQQEGCFLSIDRNALKLPPHLAIAWDVQFDNRRFVLTPTT